MVKAGVDTMFLAKKMADMGKQRATVRRVLVGAAMLTVGTGITGARAESRLPPCPAFQQYWTDCFGTHTFPNGEKYVGEFRDGKFNGQGTYTFPNGDKYAGEYKDGKSNGQGTYTFRDGKKYVGEYKDGKPNGQEPTRP